MITRVSKGVLLLKERTCSQREQKFPLRKTPVTKREASISRPEVFPLGGVKVHWRYRADLITCGIV